MPSNKIDIFGKRENNKVPEALFDFGDYGELVDAVVSVLDITYAEAHMRLFAEALEHGWNVQRSACDFGVTPHEYDDRMQKLYENTDSFVFELIATHLRKHSHVIDRRVAKAIRECGREKGEILLYGDGIGTDSLRFAHAGYEVTYFDFAGPSADFARYRFQQAGLENEIKMLHDPDEISQESYDMLICREVLEHVPAPLSLISDLRGYLKDGGLAVVTESFGRVEPHLPTHLASNAEYEGKTVELFVEEGFRYLSVFPDVPRPVVFKKVPESDTSRFGSIPEEPSYIVRPLLRRFAMAIIRRIPL